MNAATSWYRNDQGRLYPVMTAKVVMMIPLLIRSPTLRPAPETQMRKEVKPEMDSAEVCMERIEAK